jgi:nucleotide-binding universal stress UspA family protein
MITLKHILVATDFSECSAAAIEQAGALAAGFDASLHLLHVAIAPLHEPWAGEAPGEQFVHIVRRLEADALQRLDRLARTTGLAQNRLILATAWGNAADEILSYARKHQVDLIVCGTHGRRGFEHLLMGSVAERVVRLAPCPVLTAHASPAAARKALAQAADARSVAFGWPGAATILAMGHVAALLER